MAHTVACVILGAGRGTRFGEPKAGARLPGGERFVDAVARTARDAGVTEIVAVLPPGLEPPHGVHLAVNPDSASEQIVSLRIGLARLVSRGVHGALVWPVDRPFVKRDSVIALLDAVAHQAPRIAIPTHAGVHGHPVYFSRDTWRDLMTVHEGGARSVVHGLAHVALEVNVDDAGVLRNVDRPEDLLRSNPGGGAD